MAHIHSHHGCCHHQHGHHHHASGHGGDGHAHSGSNILIAFFLNLGFAVVELVGGLYTGSVAILSDALHDFGDSMSLGLAWYLERISTKGRDKAFSYGYKRFSLLSALVISLVLLIGSLVMLYTAVGKILSPQPVDAHGMLLLAVLGVAVNGYAAWRMMRGTSHSDRALRLHLLEDVLGWVAVLLVSVVMLFVDLPILDPILSICISLWILYNLYFNLRDTLKILLQGVPEGVDSERLEQELRAVPDVLDVHDLHLWTMNGEEHIASLHIVHRHPEGCARESISTLKRRVREIALHYGITHLTIELDHEGESCGMEHC